MCNTEKTVCELFAGVGGFRLGLEKSSKDWNIVWFSQWEPGAKTQWAHDCYVKHFGDIDEFTGIDIAKVDKQHIPNHNLLVGGFPCQDYSVARPRSDAKGIEGVKGVLWWQINDVLTIKRPSFVLLENVDRLLKSPSKQRGRDFGIILSCFHKQNYSVEWRVVNAAEYGGAQKRKRTFIFAYKNSTKYANSMGDIQNVIQSNGFFAKTFPVHEIEKYDIVDISSKELWEISESFEYKFENAGYMKNGIISTAHVEPISEKPIMLREIIDQNVDEEYYIDDNFERYRYLKSSKKILRTSKDGHQYQFSEGAVPFPDSLDSPARTILTSEATVNRSTHIIEDPITKRFRRLTPLETERIQGFNDNWTDTGMPKRMRYFCMGNALVVPIITRMGNTLNEIFEKED